MHTMPLHPLGTRANILLSSVFGPYAQDDAFGSRKINPMELYQNQVTPISGAFFAADVSPLFRVDDDPGEYRRPLHPAGLSVPGAF